MTSEHHGRVYPSVEFARVGDLEAVTWIVDDLAVVRVRNPARRRNGGPWFGPWLGTPTGASLRQVVREVGIAGLVEGDEMGLRQRVRAAQVELHELADLPVQGCRQGVNAVLLYVRQAREV